MNKGKLEVDKQEMARVNVDMNYTVHGILQARILEWVAFPCSRGSSQPKDQTQVSCTTGRFFTDWITREDTKCNAINIKIEYHKKRLMFT